MKIIKNIVRGIWLRVNAIMALLGLVMIGMGTYMYSKQAALIVVGSILLVDSFFDKKSRGKQ